MAGKNKKRTRETVGSVGAHRGYLKNNMAVEREAQGAEGLKKATDNRYAHCRAPS